MKKIIEKIKQQIMWFFKDDCECEKAGYECKGRCNN